MHTCTLPSRAGVDDTGGRFHERSLSSRSDVVTKDVGVARVVTTACFVRYVIMTLHHVLLALSEAGFTNRRRLC